MRKCRVFYRLPILQINIILPVALFILNTFFWCSQNHLEEFLEALQKGGSSWVLANACSGRVFSFMSPSPVRPVHPLPGAQLGFFGLLSGVVHC